MIILKAELQQLNTHRTEWVTVFVTLHATVEFLPFNNFIFKVVLFAWICWLGFSVLFFNFDRHMEGKKLLLPICINHTNLPPWYFSYFSTWFSFFIHLKSQQIKLNSKSKVRVIILHVTQPLDLIYNLTKYCQNLWTLWELWHKQEASCPHNKEHIMGK